MAREAGETPADPSRLKDLRAPYPSEQLAVWPVSPRVGNVKNNDPSQPHCWIRLVPLHWAALGG